jgi:hypothetical protein
MATPDAGAGAGATTSVTMNPWETRTLEGILVLIGALVLAFGGFVAAFPLRFGTETSAATTSSGPVTLSHLTTIGTTPTVVTEVTLTSSSSESSGRTTDSVWLGTIFGIGTLIVLSGALYRRVTSVSGFGVTIGTSGVVNDPVTQTKLRDQIQAAHPEATPDQAMSIYAASLPKLQQTLANRQVTIMQTKPAGGGGLFSILARPAAAPPTPAVTIAPDTLRPTDAEIAQVVDQAALEVLQTK